MKNPWKLLLIPARVTLAIGVCCLQVVIMGSFIAFMLTVKFVNRDLFIAGLQGLSNFIDGYAGDLLKPGDAREVLQKEREYQRLQKALTDCLESECPNCRETEDTLYRLAMASNGLAAAESYYRAAYDGFGANSIATGRAWDKMRRANAQVRGILTDEFWQRIADAKDRLAGKEASAAAQEGGGHG